MPHETVDVGQIRISALLDVDVPDEPVTDAFPGAPPDALLAAKQTYPDIYGANDVWRLRVRAWLVRHPDGVLLVDTGVGPPSSPAMAWCPAPGSLLAALAEVDASPEDVDTVAITHSHLDHVGGALLTDGSPAFPRARYLIQRADHEWEREAAATGDAEAAATWIGLLQPLSDAGVLDVIDGDHRLTDAIELHHLPGHTPGHQVVRFQSGDARALISADTWNHPVQLVHPDWYASSDDDPAAAEASRRALLTEVGDVMVAPTHFAEAFGSIRVVDGDVMWEPAGSSSS